MNATVPPSHQDVRDELAAMGLPYADQQLIKQGRLQEAIDQIRARQQRMLRWLPLVFVGILFIFGGTSSMVSGTVDWIFIILILGQGAIPWYCIRQTRRKLDDLEAQLHAA